MAEEVVLPQWGMNMREGTLVRWLKAEGDEVSEGDPLAEIETDKIESELESPVSGVLRRVLVPEGETIPVFTTLALVGSAEEELAPVTPSRPAAAAPVTASAPAPRAAVTVQVVPAARRLADERGIHLTDVTGSGPEGRILLADVEAHTATPTTSPEAPSATPAEVVPAARRLAREHGIELGLVAGSGPGGRITLDDVERAIAAPAAEREAPRASPAAVRLASERGLDLRRVKGSGPRGRIVREDIEQALAAPGTSDVPYQGTRRTVGERMLESLQTSAQLTLVSEADVTQAVVLRGDLLNAWEAEGLRVTYTDIVIRAVALALVTHPRLNAALDGDVIRPSPEINVGFAVALEEGVIVPVVHNAETKSLQSIARESGDLATRAREGQLGRDDVSGGTFTVTSLGMFGIDAFTPVINPPQAAILGVGRVLDRPSFVADTGVEIERRSFVTLSLTIDHRIVDGAPGARFLQSLGALLEHPYQLLAEG